LDGPEVRGCETAGDRLTGDEALEIRDRRTHLLQQQPLEDRRLDFGIGRTDSLLLGSNRAAIPKPEGGDADKNTCRCEDDRTEAQFV
jgi:hypothetical protein